METKEINREVSVGIWNCERDYAWVHEDRTIAHLSYVKWLGNTGSLSTRKLRLTGATHQAILTAVLDDCDDTAWEIIDRLGW